MHNSQDKQRSLFGRVQFRLKPLKFCYILMVFVLFSCGNESKRKSKENNESITETDSVQKTTSKSKTMLCFGDSITAGYGLEDSNDAYPAILQSKIDSLDLNYVVVNSGLSGETTSGGKSRINWILNQEIDIFLLELGANDGLRGLPLTDTRANLEAIIQAVRKQKPETKIILAGMQLPPNMGQNYTTGFKAIFSDLAEDYDLYFIPFILKDVGGIKALNQSDGIHPTAKGHQIIANTVWDILKPMLF